MQVNARRIILLTRWENKEKDIIQENAKRRTRTKKEIWVGEKSKIEERIGSSVERYSTRKGRLFIVIQ